MSAGIGDMWGFQAEPGTVKLELLPTFKPSTKSIYPGVPVPNKAGYSSSSSWEELSNFYDPALNILMISSISIGKELMGI
jgi:hypothetical protein